MHIAAAAMDKKADHIIVLDLRRLEAVTDYFVICTGDVDQHVRAIVKHIEDQVRQQLGERVLHREGMEALNWVLLDYVNVVAHVFKPSFREFYRLEDLWGDAETLIFDGKAMIATPAAPKRKRAGTAAAKPKAAKAATAKTTTAKPRAAVKKAPAKTATKTTTKPATRARKTVITKAVEKPTGRKPRRKSADE
jgi:ribosome-associated protein